MGIQVQTFEQPLDIDDAVTHSGPNQFIITTPWPRPGVLDHAAPNHVQVYITKAVQQVFAILDHGALIRMLPDRALMFFSLVELCADRSRRQLHEASDGVLLCRMGNDVHMVACNAKSENRYAIALGTNPQPLS